MHAIFKTKAECEKYRRDMETSRGYPKLEGVPGGDDPTGRRHLYPVQRMTEHLEDIKEAADGSECAYPLDERIDPGPKAKKEKLDGEKWKAAVSAAVAEEVPTKK